MVICIKNWSDNSGNFFKLLLINKKSPDRICNPIGAVD
jgi:hypothetical protein